VTFLEPASDTVETGHATEMNVPAYTNHPIPKYAGPKAPNGVGPCPVFGLTISIWQHMSGPVVVEQAGIASP
jgi:hypothetical protein